MNLDQLLTDSGLTTTSLSPAVKAAMDRVLQTAGYKALQEVLALLKARAEQTSGGTPATNSATIDEKAVKDALAEIDARNLGKAKRRKILYFILGGLTLLGTIAALLIGPHHRKH